MPAPLSLRSDNFEHKDGQKSAPSIDGQFPVRDAEQRFY